MIQFATFPRTWSPPEWVGRMVEMFRLHESAIGTDQSQATLSSEEVLAVLGGDLERLGFLIEKLKRTDLKLPSAPPPPLGPGGSDREHAAERYHFDVYHPDWHCCIAIEDGPAWTHDAIDEDAVEPLLVANADTLCLALPGCAPGGRLVDSEYDRAVTLAQAVYQRSRPYLPHRLVLIGY